MHAYRLLRALILVSALIGLVSFNIAYARNYPCSGKKGGVSHCQNGKFICKDGSISSSKMVCR